MKPLMINGHEIPLKTVIAMALIFGSGVAGYTKLQGNVNTNEVQIAQVKSDSERSNADLERQIRETSKPIADLKTQQAVTDTKVEAIAREQKAFRRDTKDSLTRILNKLDALQ